jgi:hypothetical protein
MSTAQSDPQDIEPQAVADATIPNLKALLDGAQQTARDILEADQALRLVRVRFERAGNPEARGELAAEALDHVDRQLELTRERRQALDRVEGTLWARRNRLEQFLIQTRGIDWWHARRDTSRSTSQMGD